MLYRQVADAHGQKIFRPGKNDLIIIELPAIPEGINDKSAGSFAPVRSFLYGLASVKLKGKLYDLGKLVQTQTVADSYRAIENIASIIGSGQATCIVLAPSQEYVLPLYRGLIQSRKPVSVSIIDSRLDIDNDNDDIHHSNYLNRLLTEPLSHLLDLSVIGFQGYFAGADAMKRITSKGHELVRLGKLRSGFHEVEPSLRNADLINLDLCAIRASDYPHQPFPSPNGLYAEEACRLAMHSGLSEKNNLFVLSGYGAAPAENSGVSSMLAAQIIWHYIEGFTSRIAATPLHNPRKYKKFIVNTGTRDIDMHFYFDELNNRWWFDFSHPDNPQQRLVVPCSQHDYLLATRHEISERWYRFFDKYRHP